MEVLLQEFSQEAQHKTVLMRLYGATKYRWELYGPDLLHCYDIPGLPPDNLQLESLFNRLRNHQRRVSSRKSTPLPQSANRRPGRLCAPWLGPG